MNFQINHIKSLKLLLYISNLTLFQITSFLIKDNNLNFLFFFIRLRYDGNIFSNHKSIYIYQRHAHADSTHALAEISTLSSTYLICLFLDYSTFPPLGSWSSMCYFTTVASALKMTTVLPSLRASFS